MNSISDLEETDKHVAQVEKEIDVLDADWVKSQAKWERAKKREDRIKYNKANINLN